MYKKVFCYEMFDDPKHKFSECEICQRFFEFYIVRKVTVK